MNRTIKSFKGKVTTLFSNFLIIYLKGLVHDAWRLNFGSRDCPFRSIFGDFCCSI